jgi:hypothetical protein
MHDQQENLLSEIKQGAIVSPQVTKVRSTKPSEGKPNLDRLSQPLDKSQQTKILTLQRTLYDFHYFKPHASISPSDPDTFGHIPESIYTDSTFRLLLQNPNGICPSVTNPNFMFSLHLCNEIGAGAICLAETNLNWHHTQHPASLRRCLHRNWSASKYQMSIPDEVFLGDYQPGGTLTLIVDRWTSRVIKSGMDPYGLGRWSYVILRGKQNINICVVSAYRVCNEKYTGPKTVYQQQRRQLCTLFRQKGKVVDPNPNRQFILDLQSWLSYIHLEGSQVILSLDNNEELSPSSSQALQLPYNPNMPTLHT